MSRLVATSRRIGFVVCGLPVRFRLLPTPPHGDAVTFHYEVLAYPDTDLHRVDTDAFAGALIPAKAGMTIMPYR
jgi:hypothetical protein